MHLSALPRLAFPASLACLARHALVAGERNKLGTLNLSGSSGLGGSYDVVMSKKELLEQVEGMTEEETRFGGLKRECGLHEHSGRADYQI